MPDPRQEAQSGAGFWLLLGLAALVIALDQWAKYAILTHFAYGETLPLTSFFDLTLTYNQGAAFGFLHQAGGWQRWLLSALGIGVSLWITWWLRWQGGAKLFRFSLALIMGGALGNVIDRFIHDGVVVDFLDFHLAQPYELNILGHQWLLQHFPAFNLADSAITCGVALLLLEGYIEHRRAHRVRTASSGE